MYQNEKVSTCVRQGSLLQLFGDTIFGVRIFILLCLVVW